MKKLSSMSDFYIKVQNDIRYRYLIIYGYNNSGFSSSKTESYEDALKWVESWLENYKKKTPVGDYDCERMINYLNDCMTQHDFIAYLKRHNLSVLS